MSSETAPEEKRKRRSTSIPLLIIVVIVGLVGYFRGEEIMTYTMYLQEQWSHNSKVSEDKRQDKLAGPAKEGEFDWVSPDVDGSHPAASSNPTEDAGSKPTPMPTPETPAP